MATTLATATAATGQLAVPFLEQVQETTPIAPDWRISTHAQDNRQNAFVAAELEKRGYTKQAGRLLGCGSRVGYWHCFDCGDESREVTSLCNQPRLCVRCARIERIKQQCLAMETLSTARLHTPVGYDVRELTLTIRTNGDYEGAVRRAGKALSELNRNVLGGRKLPNTALLACFEFGPLNGNVHIHAVYWGPHVHWEDLLEAWKHYTKGEGFRVWITCKREKPLDKRVAHAMKYAHDFHSKGKGPEAVVTPERVVDVFEALNNKHIHLRRRYGLFNAKAFRRWLGDRPHLFIIRDGEDENTKIECPCCNSRRRLYVFSYDTERGPPLPLHCLQ